jgi:GT2 family glycosyltransferase
VVFLNNDTFVESNWLEALVNALDVNPSVGACQSRVLFAKTKEVQSAGMLLDCYGWSLGLTMKQDLNVVMNRLFYPSGTSVIVRRSIMEKCRGFDEIIFSGDYDLGWMIRLYGYKIAVSNKSICYHYGGYATTTLFAHPEQFYEACKERIYVLLKNYSFSRIIIRVPVSLVLMFLASIVWCQRDRKDYLISLSKALTWNLKNFRKLMIKRNIIQRDRKVRDCEIEQFMSKYPFMVLLSKNVLLKE